MKMGFIYIGYSIFKYIYIVFKFGNNPFSCRTAANNNIETKQYIITAAVKCVTNNNNTPITL